MNLLWLINSAAAESTEVVEEIVEKAQTAGKFPSGIAIIVVVVALIIAIVVVSSMKAQLKTAHKKSGAVEYIKTGSFDLFLSKDQFLYETTEKKKIANNNQK